MSKLRERYMYLAIAAAHKAKRDGGVAIGSVIVNESTGLVVAVGESLVGVTKDPTAHAEVNCIRAAAAKLGTDDLFDLTLYSTLEPCHMCLSAAAWARIPRVYFGAYRKDVDATLFDVRDPTGDEQEATRMNLREPVQMKAVGGLLEAECAALLASYHDRARHANR
jgi:tRNA(Arg) A34 adenosine deaminase TadA